MTKFLQYLLHVQGSPAQPVKNLAVYVLPKQLKSMYGLSHAGKPTGIGLAWIQIGDPTSPSMIMQKTGGGAGFETYIALNPKRQAGVFLAATEGVGRHEVEFFRESNHLLAALAGVPEIVPEVRKARALDKHTSVRHAATKHAAPLHRQKRKAARRR